MYFCKMCGAVADVENAELKKSCACECGVTMDMGTATLVNFSTLKESNLKETLAALVNLIIARIKEIGGKAELHRPD